MGSRGVVTLADQNYFPGLVHLHASIRSSWPCPIICYDVGLAPEQREAAAMLPDLAILQLPADPLIESLEDATRDQTPLLKPNKRIWPLWICPLLIRAVPLEDVFWLDCDILVLRGLDELFARLEDGPVFTPETKAPEATPNATILYELLPITRLFDPRQPVVNGGVSGWRKGRDDAALAAYIAPVEAAIHDARIMQAISWHDQGALIWAIQSLGLERRVMQEPYWNFCIDRVRLPDEIMRWDDGLCNRLRAALPDVRLLHWNGARPPWMT